ncbi:hypothetical protein B7463_g4014, partial [Scytalidium lignicola]
MTFKNAAVPSIDAIIIGAGPSGISMAHSLKHTLGFNNFTIYEKLDGPGGTWRTNTYPGCGCDVPTHLYSFSFNLNPEWSKELCDQEEILQYYEDMEATVDKFDLRPHMHFQVACLGATWLANKGKWEVHLHDLVTDIKYSRETNVFVSAVGGISEPRDVRFPGMEDFKGAMFHTARWDHSYNHKDKSMLGVPNGTMSDPTATSPASKDFASANDNLVATYMPGKSAEEKRLRVEADAKSYIYRMTPKKYHDFIVPDFPLGCKRRIFDPNYLEALHSENLSLVPEGIKMIDETGITSESGEHEDFDVIVLATGFKVTDFLTPMEIIGSTGVSLADQWKQCRGAQAYWGTYVHNFPNFGILFGPNTFPAHNSALFACEVQVSYVTNTLFRPLLSGSASIVEVKGSAEDFFANSVQLQLNGSVFSAGCSNWVADHEEKRYTDRVGEGSGGDEEEFVRGSWKDTLIVEKREGFAMAV